jgi:hypothetical protein
MCHGTAQHTYVAQFSSSYAFDSYGFDAVGTVICGNLLC